jgi:hypothetical protein
MTRKLTDEQVTAIKKLSSKGSSCFAKIEIQKELHIIIQTIECIDDPNTYWQLFPTALSIDVKNFKTADQAIAYAEHLLNQRYCWLPKNNGWIMSGEVYDFANNGANKVLELMWLAEQAGYDFQEGEIWWVWNSREYGYCPDFNDLAESITIPAESPIWDAVKGVEL